MYENIPLAALVPHPLNSNRISKNFARKLHRNISETGHYETLTVRPHLQEKGRFQILNGHVRFSILSEQEASTARCDIWNVGDDEAKMFLAILNKLRGSETPELRMGLLSDLLGKFSAEELAANIPESKGYLERIDQLPDELVAPTEKEEKPPIVMISFYLDKDDRGIVIEALDHVSSKFSLPDSSSALVKLAKLYLDSR